MGSSAAPAPTETEVLYVGASQSVEQELAQRSGLCFAAVETGQLRGRAPWVVARNLGRMARGVRQSTQILATFRPDAVLVTGGYVCAPVVMAARRQGVPVLIYLPDVMPGLAVRLLSRFAKAVAVTCPEAARYFGAKAVVTGYPVRADLAKAGRERSAARQVLGLRPQEKVLMVFGGSRGAHSINCAVSTCLPELLEASQVLHVTGSEDLPMMQESAARLPQSLRDRYHGFKYLHDEMAYALASADLAVSRAGAAVLGEYPLLGLPSVLVPYPHAGRHQEANANYLASNGAAEILDDNALQGGLASTVLRLLNTESRLRQMSAQALQLARPEAAARIGRLLDEMAGKRGVHTSSTGGN